MSQHTGANLREDSMFVVNIAVLTRVTQGLACMLLMEDLKDQPLLAIQATLQGNAILFMWACMHSGLPLPKSLWLLECLKAVISIVG